MNVGITLQQNAMYRSSRIDSVTPSSGSPLGGLVVTLTGAGFLDSQVSVAGNIVVPLSIPDDGTMTFLMLSLGLGPREIRVTGPLGLSNAANFTITL